MWHRRGLKVRERHRTEGDLKSFAERLQRMYQETGEKPGWMKIKQGSVHKWSRSSGESGRMERVLKAILCSRSVL